MRRMIVRVAFPEHKTTISCRAFAALALPFLLAGAVIAQTPDGLLFHAPFDGGTGARVAGGDKRLWSAASYKEQSAAAPGLGAAANVSLAPGEGRGGSGALRFKAKNTNAVFYKADGNTAFRGTGWTGTISFFLKLDPEKDLEPGFCDPIQVTDKAYNDSAIWVDFTKDDKPRHFRLGVFGALKSWNPQNLPADKFPAFNNRVVVMRKTPFAAGRWTHIAIVHEGLGGGKGRATLFVDGAPVGSAEAIAEPFEWDPALGAIRLGVNYVGLMDDVMVFGRALSADAVRRLGR